MITLASVEIRRLISRRLFKVLTALVILAFAVIGTIVFVAADDSPERVAQAQAQRQADIASCIQGIHAPGNDYPAEAARDPQQFCRDETYGGDPRFPFADMQWILTGFGMPLMMLGWLLGASFVGAEWNNRTMTTTLTWQARRIRVLGAKALALAIVTFIWIVLLQAWIVVAFLPAGLFEGSMAGVDAGWWGSTGLFALRAGALAAMAGIFGLSLAAIGRNTAAALGVGFVYLAVVEGMIRGFRPSWVDWLVGDNAGLLLVGSDEVTHLGHSEAAAALLLTIYCAAVLVLALAFFRRRDVA